ncbi:MAG TPA: hypothetical protein VJ922_09650 [Actinomycetota bacterium]|nr:hypothetical protein [Actinomycetota bacterium]
MRKGVGRTRRVVAAAAVSMVALLATGTGANAASPILSVKNYAAEATASVLDINLALPTALNPVLSALDIANPITESISMSQALAQIDKAKDSGSGKAQMFLGNLDTKLEMLSTTLLGKKLPIAFAPLSLVDKVVHQDLAALDLGGLIKVGISDVNASSTLKNLGSGVKAVKSVADSKLVGVTVGLTTDLINTLKGVLQPVLDLTDAPNSGLIDTINGLLTPVEDLVETTLGVPVALDLPKIGELLQQSLVSIGVIETKTITDFATGVRNATGFSRMADIDLFGKGENALVHIDALTTKTFAQVGETAGAAKATAIHEIVGLRVLDNEIGLLKGEDLAVSVNGKQLALPLDVLNKLNELIFDTLGLDIKVFDTEKSATASLATAKARTLAVTIAPNIAGNELFNLTIQGPGSEVLAAGTNVEGKTFPGPHPTTGVSTNLYLIAGPALIGMAVLVRRFALVK